MDLMFNRIINSNVIIKLQDRNEKEFNEKEYLNHLFKKSKKKFLERFFQYLIPDDVYLFEIANDNDKLIIEYYLKKIYEPMNKKLAKVKNRRYEALQRLIKQGEYFDDESMKSREPLLYEEMIGKYEQSNNQTTSSSSTGLHLTDFLMKHLENINHDDRLNQLKSLENDQNEESDEDEEEEEEEEEDEDRKQEMRNEFLTIMHRKFLNGEDINFDYRSIDLNDDYDNVEIESRDLEEKYFDDD
jgi:hypothetical protein